MLLVPQIRLQSCDYKTAGPDISMGDGVGNKGAGMSPFFEAI